MLCADLVEVEWEDPSGQLKTTIAHLEDISVSGACLQVDLALPLHTKLRVTHANGDLTGRVRYCVYREIGYFVGIEFHASCKWSQQNFEPLHLLDLRWLTVNKSDAESESAIN